MSASPPPQQRDKLIYLTIPEGPGSVLEHAKALLHKHGHNCKRVSHVYPASHPVGEGRETILYETAAGTKITAFVSYNRGRLLIEKENGWLSD